MNVLRLFRRACDRFMGGRGEFSITVPVMDGPLKPNDRLERARSVAVLPAVDNATVVGGRLLVTAGDAVLSLEAPGTLQPHSRHQAPISCLAASEAGALAVGLDGTGVRIVGGRHDGLLLDRLGSVVLRCPTAALFLGEDTLIVSNGSAPFTAAQWSHDLLHHGRSGTVLRIDLGSKKATVLAAGLAFPSGLCLAGDGIGGLLVSEAWRHRVIALDKERQAPPREILAGLPSYPGRICRAGAGGYWLALFATRSQLQEFVLREDRFRRQMIAEIDPEFWIAPSLSSGHSFKEPLQAGGVIRLGVHKPWAPTRSYGLVARLDEDFQPVWSAHSRADGTRHGITSVAERRGALFATSKGKGEIVAIDDVSLDEPEDFAAAPGHAA
ncbi:MAG TPA: hypothetical protein VHA10_17890 [Hypericibacter adhaerens]|uniref:hypothetical protein n=1 Tax=Hypericibacter adhaerens TaxID=2602016 RepID=UPI002C1126AF|nr:hypothetical protein [Hypericibacter adhaerens]HWA45097.1 hypothetical protein [Hypericibacter adhaerens]